MSSQAFSESCPASVQAHGSGHSRFASPADCVPAVATLIAGAMATLDLDPDASRHYLKRASAILKACAARDPHSGHVVRTRGGLAHWQLNRVVDYIEHHLSERITGEDLADLIDVSVGQLFRAFKANVGVPPLQYVASRRLERACRLLRNTEEPLSQIAVTAGFCDQSHLCRVFRRLLGATPATWRRQNAAAPDACLAEGRTQPRGRVDLRPARIFSGY